MKRIFFFISLLAACSTPQQEVETPAEVAQWEEQAQRVTIIRDRWGVPMQFLGCFMLNARTTLIEWK